MLSKICIDGTRRGFEEIYGLYNRREYVSPDPLQVLYDYDNPADREIAALIASSLAFGRVGQILKSIALVLGKMPSPARFVRQTKPDEISERFRGFKHRWVTEEDLAATLVGAGELVDEYGTLEGAFAVHVTNGQETALEPSRGFLKELREVSGRAPNRLIPDPEGSSACKRFNLFLRWMVRSDEVDPGGWSCIDPGMLIVPLDTHMHNICRQLGLTGRRQADMKTALQITDAFRKVNPEDPVRYDFALTRLGIRQELDIKTQLAGIFH